MLDKFGTLLSNFLDKIRELAGEIFHFFVICFATFATALAAVLYVVIPLAVGFLFWWFTIVYGYFVFTDKWLKGGWFIAILIVIFLKTIIGAENETISRIIYGLALIALISALYGYFIGPIF